LHRRHAPGDDASLPADARQYDNTVRALTGLDVRPSTDFPVDQNQAGFDRGMDLQAAMRWARPTAPPPKPLAASVAGSATAFSKVVGCESRTGNACRDMFIASFGRRVFRRPLTDAEKAPYVSLFAQGRADRRHRRRLPQGVQLVVEALCRRRTSSNRPELATQVSGGVISLGGYELASRLSFFLVNGPPDDALLDAAGGGQLATADGVATQARRLIATDAAKETVRDFITSGC
jgi:hypothetical protein